MSIFSLNPRMKSAKAGKTKASPYDWADMPSDPLVENPKVLTALAPWQTGVSAAAGSAAERLSGPQDDALYNTLNTQAQHELALGGELAEDEVRSLDQGTRAGFAARGMVNSPMAGFAEVLRRLGATTARRRERQGFASGVYGLGQKRRELDTNILQTTGLLGNQTNEFAEDIRRFGINRFDTKQFNKNRITADEIIGKANNDAAKSAAKTSATGGIIGGILKLF